MAIPPVQQDSEFFSLSISPHVIVEKITQAYVDSSIYPDIRTDTDHTIGFVPSGAIYATGSIQARAHMYLTKNSNTIIYICLHEQEDNLSDTDICIYTQIPQILGKKRDQPYTTTKKEKNIRTTEIDIPTAIFNQLYILRMLDHVDTIIPISIGKKIDIKQLHKLFQTISKKVPSSTIIFTAPEAIQSDNHR